jgi:hypothetical protein
MQRELPALLNLLAREAARLMEADWQAFPNWEKRELGVYSRRAKVL